MQVVQINDIVESLKSPATVYASAAGAPVGHTLPGGEAA